MTVVSFHYTLPDEDGDLLPAGGWLRFTPTKRRYEGNTVVLPLDFRVPLDDDGKAEAVLAPTDPRWVWKISEELLRTRHQHVYVVVPDTDEVLAKDLQQVDPTTLEPSPEALAGWEAVINEAQQLRTETVDAASIAAGFTEDVLSATERTHASEQLAKRHADDAQLDITHDPDIGFFFTQGGTNG